jgi:hypothetical protein
VATYLAEGDRHYTNLFAAIVGSTSKGRKGTSWGQIKRPLHMTDEQFALNCITSGLSSGEGLIWAVRDEIREQQPIRERGRVVSYQEVTSDPGVLDERLLVQESEFARVLQTAQRNGNSISAVIREAWDSGNLNTLTKGQAARSTNAHIGQIVHVTAEELNRLLTQTEVANGFANRYLWVCTERSKELPFGGNLTEAELHPIAHRLQEIRSYSQSAGQIRFDPDAAEDWRLAYGPLSAGRPGLLGAIVGRAEAQVVRLATLYALLDCENTIRPVHLKAALAIWDYAEQSASYIFGDALGDETADTILAHLRSVGTTGATQTEISQLFHRNKTAQDLGRALNVLVSAGLAHYVRQTGTLEGP